MFSLPAALSLGSASCTEFLGGGYKISFNNKSHYLLRIWAKAYPSLTLISLSERATHSFDNFKATSVMLKHTQVDKDCLPSQRFPGMCLSRTVLVIGFIILKFLYTRVMVLFSHKRNPLECISIGKESLALLKPHLIYPLILVD